MKKNQHDIHSIKKNALLGIFSLPVVLGMLLFIPAGTIMYWEAWLYILILFIPTLIIVLYLLVKNPELIERRMRFKEEKKTQNKVVILSALLIVAVFITSGLDKRFGWSKIPAFVIIILDIEIICCYLFFFRVLLENKFASRTIGIEEEQILIATGPYRIIRHPMYLAILMILINTPFVLGTYWAAFGNIGSIILIIIRIKEEEKMLIEELEGYYEYMERVKYRLIPGLW